MREASARPFCVLLRRSGSLGPFICKTGTVTCSSFPSCSSFCQGKRKSLYHRSQLVGRDCGLRAYFTFQQVRIGVLLQLGKPRVTPPGRVTVLACLRRRGFLGHSSFTGKTGSHPASRTHTPQGTVSESKVWQSSSRLYFPLSVFAK